MILSTQQERYSKYSDSSLCWMACIHMSEFALDNLEFIFLRLSERWVYQAAPDDLSPYSALTTWTTQPLNSPNSGPATLQTTLECVSAADWKSYLAAEQSRDKQQNDPSCNCETICLSILCCLQHLFLVQLLLILYTVVCFLCFATSSRLLLTPFVTVAVQ